MVQTRSSSKKNTTDTNIEVNRDVAEASNKNTMNQNKRKTTTAENSVMPIEASKKTTKKAVNACDAGTSKKSKSSENPKFAFGVYEGKVIARPITEEDLARNAFMLEYRRKYFPGLICPPDEEKGRGNKKLFLLVKTTK